MVILLFLTLEATLQIISYARYAVPLLGSGNSATGAAHTLIPSWWTEESHQLASVYHPALSWIMRRQDTPHIHIDEQGIRRTTNTAGAETPQRVYVFGGSTIFGVQAADDETIPSYLSRRMSDTASPRYVRNMGQLGYTLPQQVRFFTELLKTGDVPALAIFYFGCNDLYVSLRAGKPMQVFQQQEIRNRLGNIWLLHGDTDAGNYSLINRRLLTGFDFSWITPRHIKLIYYPSAILKRLRRVETPPPATGELSAPQRQAIADHIITETTRQADFLETLAKTYGFRYMLALQPILYTKSHQSPQEAVLIEKAAAFAYDRYSSELYATIAAGLRRSGRHITDLTPAVSGRTDTIYTDECHMLPTGNAVIADELFRNLSESGMQTGR